MAMQINMVDGANEEVRIAEFDVEFSDLDKRKNTHKELVDWAFEGALIEMDLPKKGPSWSITYNERVGFNGTLNLRITARRMIV